MSKFDKNYEYKQKLKEAKLLINKSDNKNALKLLEECYKYFYDEHLIRYKLDTINHLIDLYLTLRDYKKTKSLFIEHESESNELGIDIPPHIYHSYGRYFSGLGNTTKSIENYNIAIKKYTLNNDLLHAAISYMNLAEQLRQIGDFDQAAIAFINSRDIFLKYGEYDLSLKPLLSMTDMLTKLRGRSIPIDLEKMEFILEKGNLPQSPTLATTFINVGLIFQEIGNCQKAIHYLKKAIDLSKELKYDQTEFHAYLNLGYVYGNLHQYTKAKINIEKALNYYIKERNRGFIAKAYNAYGFIYKDEGDIETAFSYIQKSIEIGKDIVDFELSLRNYEILANIYKLKNDLKNSLIAYSELLRIYNKLFEESDLFGLKQIFREQFSRILHIIININELLKNQSLELSKNILEDLEDDVIKICKTGASNDILEDSLKIQFQEEIVKLEKKIAELTSLINERDKKELEEKVINDICEKIELYQAEKFSPTKIKDFLIQIPNPILRHNLLIRILSRVPKYYYTKEKMYRKLKKIIQKLPFDENDEIIFGVLSETWNKSQNLWSYMMERSISRYGNTEIKKTPQLFKFLSKVKNDKRYFVIFMDDVIGSGRQFIKYYKNDFEKKLQKYSVQNKENIHFYLISGVISKEAIEYISTKSIFDIKSIKYHKIIKKKDKAFSKEGWDEENLSDLKKYLCEIDPTNWDGWKKEPDKEKGMEYLVVLDWRTPNNTIGILWNNKSKIKPLFPR